MSIYTSIPQDNGTIITKTTKKQYISNYNLPENYTALEYIESTGTQCIDTGFKPNHNTSIMLDFQFTTITGTMFPFCARGGSAQSYSKPYGLLLSNTTYRSDFGTSQVSSSSVPVNTDRIILFKIRNTCFINDSTITNAMNNFQSDYSMTLFASADGGTPNYFAKMKLYTCQLSDNGTIIRNYIPCINPNNEIGLYDLVNSTFYGNNGTGTFIAGPEVENKVVTKKIKKGYTITGNFDLAQLPERYTQIEYIESSGTQYIDTGFIPNSNTNVILDLDVHQINGNWHGIFGVRTNAIQNAYAIFLNSNVFYSDYYNASSQLSINILGRHVIQKNKNISTLDTNIITHTASTFSCDYTMTLGKIVAHNSDIQYEGLYGKIYSCKIYDNGTLIRDFIPCINSSNIVGLYDLVSKTFYGNSGTGAFIAGPTHKKITKLFYEGGN